MNDLDHLLTEGLSSDDSAVVHRWLAGLSDATRAEMAVLWDRRIDRCSKSFEMAENGQVHWHALPMVRGRFVRPGEVADDAEWCADHYEYLLDHPEIWVVEDPANTGRRFHIGCTAHIKAREVLKSGLIPADFACPLENESCPLRAILRMAPGHSFNLFGPA